MLVNMSNTLSTQSVDTSTLVELLRWQALNQPDRRVFTFLRQGETEEGTITCSELDRQARAIAALLQSRGAAGKPALLLHPPGLEYIAAFFGCLYAGVIAVPAYPPRSARTMPRIQAIIADTQSDIILTTDSTLAVLHSYFAGVAGMETLQWIATDRIADYLADDWQEPYVTGDTLAFLQYTSGSTATPKGVMVTHSNLLHNLTLINKAVEQTTDSYLVSWLPPYHDMGLIGGILYPLHGGFAATLMSPVSFLQRPFRWLQAISRTRATISVAPNFAFDLCTRKVTPEQRATLDLSRWNVAFNGAEPVRSETLERFSEMFASCGFRKETFYPGYGLAEATLMVSGGKKSAPPVIQPVQRFALERNKVVVASQQEWDSWRLVGCGKTLPGQKIIIVNPDTQMECPPEKVGEIWLSGPCVAQGYWNKPAETEYTFNAYVADTEEGPFLRTGDLGFLKDDELFVTGRLKDMIIINGRNHYPQDIELTVEHCHPAIRQGCCVAFAIDEAGKEQLIVLAEIDPRCQPDRDGQAGTRDRILDGQALTRTIFWELWEQHDLQPHKVVLLKAGSILKTSSGKLQRRACREAFLSENLTIWGT